MKKNPDRHIGLSADMQEEIQKARPHVRQRRFDELERHGHVVFHTSFVKTTVFALGSWIFVAFIVMVFAATPISSWNLLHFFIGFVLAAGFVVFGFGALMWTFVFPVVRPRLVVSRWGVQSIGWKPGGTFTVFSAAWPQIVAVRGFHTYTRWPAPPALHVMLTARKNGVRRAPWIRVRSQDSTVAYGVNTMLRGRRREVFAFLVHVHAAVLSTG